MLEKLFNKIRAKLMPVKKESSEEIKIVGKEISGVPMDFLRQNRNIPDIGKREFIKKGAIGLGVGAGAALLSKIPFADARLFASNIELTNPLPFDQGGTGQTTWAQGDLLYASAADTLSRLTKGAADTKLFMNAGGTVSEWAGGIKVGLTSRDTSLATGTQAITGVGFKPSHIILMANVDSSSQNSMGFDDGTAHYLIYNAYHVASSLAWTYQNAYCIALYQGASDYYRGQVTVLGADGFTISWTKTGSKTGTAQIIYIAFR